jgi:glutathione synthase/RimK-type ligase-like ATP-grasp enzyme
MNQTIAIVTVENDLHAYAIAHELRYKHHIRTYIIEVERLNTSYQFVWNLNDAVKTGSCIMPSSEILDLSSIGLIWWRRLRTSQQLDNQYDPVQIDLINNDWKGSVRGILETLHKGVWVSTPWATERASNKLWQLQVAQRRGFRVPETLVSNNPQSVKEFVDKYEKRGVIVKPVIGTKQALLFTQKVNSSQLNDESIRICPAIYQEYILGTRHLRVNCFGHQIFAFEIITDELDWRPNLHVTVKACSLDSSLQHLILAVLNDMQLEMGIVDLKIDESGSAVWFEVNPQGQFLFLEGLTKQPLQKIFACFLADRLTDIK